MSKKKIKSKPPETVSIKKYIKEHARKLELYKCMCLSGQYDGMKHIIVARKRRNDTILVGVYLIDLYCLGLKDTFFTELENDDEFNEKFISISYSELKYEDIEPNMAFNLIYGAIEYAEDLGFKPHKDFAVTEYILDDVETVDYIDIEFGFEGKPFFIAGENDKAGLILAQLDKAVGSGNYHYVKVTDFFDSEEDDDEEEEYDDEEDEYDDEEEEDDDDENDNDYTLFTEDKYEEELDELKSFDEKEFTAVLSRKLASIPKIHKVNFYLTMLVALNIEEYFDYDELLERFRDNSKGLINEIIKNVSQSFPNDKPFVKNFNPDTLEPYTRTAIENYLKFGGIEFLGLNDFAKAMEIYDGRFNLDASNLAKENISLVADFILPIEYKKRLQLALIMNQLTEIEGYESDYNKLNIFEKTKLAKHFISLKNILDKGKDLEEKYETLENLIWQYFDLRFYFNEISDTDLVKEIIEISIKYKS